MVGKNQKMSQELKLNVACGNKKIPGYVNIDGEITNNPDQVVNILEIFPFERDSVSEILFFHAIEHIPKNQHAILLAQFHRVLKPGCYLYISYPEFTKVAMNYISNYRGMREFWEATIYGLQRYPGDAHVSLMDTKYFIPVLQEVGFVDIEYHPETPEDFNTMLRAKKGPIPNDYEDIIAGVGKSSTLNRSV
jgi:predicted SAM-dependent methyltransferase